MRIEISVDSLQPPAGHARSDSSAAAPEPFIGWLGLLRAISVLIDCRDTDDPHSAHV